MPVFPISLSGDLCEYRRRWLLRGVVGFCFFYCIELAFGSPSSSLSQNTEKGEKRKRGRPEKDPSSIEEKQCGVLCLLAGRGGD